MKFKIEEEISGLLGKIRFYVHRKEGKNKWVYIDSKDSMKEAKRLCKDYANATKRLPETKVTYLEIE